MVRVHSAVSYDMNGEASSLESVEPDEVALIASSKDAVSESVYGVRNQAEKIEAWLRQYGFTYNPFQFTNSERDTNLTQHFVEYPDFDKMLELHDRLFFARIGDGKTAMRLRLQSFYRDSVRDHHVFAFSYLIPQEIASNPPLSITGHLDVILTAAVRHAFVFFALRGIDLPILQNEESAKPLAQQFAAYFDHYYGLENTWRTDLQQAIADYSLRQVVRNLDPVYDDLETLDDIGDINPLWLKRWLQLLAVDEQSATPLPTKPLQRWRQFCELVQATGIHTLLILIDGVDVKPGGSSIDTVQSNLLASEQAEKQEAINRMVSTINPLLGMIKDKMLGQSVAWKLFLPMELYLPLISYLSNHFSHDILYWDYKRLSELLKFRLSVATNGAITTLLQLAEEDVPADLETFLIVQAVSSPRYLIDSINKIFGTHVDQMRNHRLPSKLSASLLSQIPYRPHHPT